MKFLQITLLVLLTSFFITILMLNGLNLRSIAYLLYDWVFLWNFYCSYNKIHKPSNLQGHPFIILQSHRLEVWHGSTGSSSCLKGQSAGVSQAGLYPDEARENSFPLVVGLRSRFTCRLSARVCTLLVGYVHTHVAPPSHCNSKSELFSHANAPWISESAF